MHDYSKLSGTRRMRFREWLISKLDSGEITGVQWLDKQKGVFKIPWKHGSGRNWCPTDANIFKEWAKHSGKFVEGRDRADPCKWKTNFRCTLNALPDFEEIRQQSSPRGPDAYKIYRLNKKQTDLVKKEEKKTEVLGSFERVIVEMVDEMLYPPGDAKSEEKPMVAPRANSNFPAFESLVASKCNQEGTRLLPHELYLAAWNALAVDMHDEKQSATSEDEFVDVENVSVENGEISS